MRIRKIRNAKVAHVGRFPFYRYETRDGVETCTGIEEQVQVVLEVTDEGPEKGREVRLRMSQADAEAHIARLQEALEAARRRGMED